MKTIRQLNEIKAEAINHLEAALRTIELIGGDCLDSHGRIAELEARLAVVKALRRIEAFRVGDASSLCHEINRAFDKIHVEQSGP